MSELLKKQNYGVEVEFTGITRAMAAEAVAEVIGSTVTGPDHTCYHTRIIRDSQGRKWKIMRDSSIIPVRKTGNANMDEYRVEFVTPILKYDDLETLQAIIRKFREIGGVPHGACVPWTEFNQKMLFRKNSDNTECVNKDKSINIPKGSQENS